MAALVLFAVGCGLATFQFWRAAVVPPAPEPAAVAVWLPIGAEIKPAEQIHPGTFSVELSLGEFKRRFPGGGLVSVPDRCLRNDQFCFVTLWQPQIGTALFYRLSQRISPPLGWPQGFGVGRVEIVGDRIIAHPVYIAITASLLGLTFSATAGSMALLVLVFAAACRRQST